MKMYENGGMVILFYLFHLTNAHNGNTKDILFYCKRATGKIASNEPEIYNWNKSINGTNETQN